MRLLLAALGAATVAAAPLAAQSPTDAGGVPRLLLLPASTRALGMGDAYPNDAGHADAIFYHPGLLGDASGFGLGAQRWDGGTTALEASAATSWWSGGVAVGLRSLTYTEPIGLDGSSTVPVSERVGSVGFGKGAFGLEVGVVAKWIERRQGGARDQTVGVDLGVAREVGPFAAALSARNLGPGVAEGDVVEDLPLVLELGLGAYGRPVGPFDLGVAGSLRWLDEELVPGAGVELGYWPVPGRTFVARAGVRRVVDGDARPFTLGGSYWGDDLVLEWAWQPFDEGSGTHRFGVRWR